MTDLVQSAPKNKSRIELIDAARGGALIAMAIYHFAWDLEFFGYAAQGMTAVGGWRLFARSIASSFLFLVGFSLLLAHVRGVRWQSFWWRMVQVGGAAAAITLVTYFATPDAFIFFGILHHIALASLVGLVFLRLPAFGIAAIAIVDPSTPTNAKTLSCWISFCAASAAARSSFISKRSSARLRRFRAEAV